MIISETPSSLPPALFPLPQDAKAAREQVGVELYGFQQHLAKLQAGLERSSERFAAAAAARADADARLRELRQQVAEEESLTAAQQERVDDLQRELDRLAETLRQIGRHNEALAGEVAVTKRVASATEGAVQRLEKAKAEQDFLIDGLQGQLARLGRQLELHSARLDAQRLETRAAQEFLAKAVSDMEGVQFEKRQLVAQWKSSLLAMERRDEALEVGWGRSKVEGREGGGLGSRAKECAQDMRSGFVGGREG